MPGKSVDFNSIENASFYHFYEIMEWKFWSSFCGTFVEPFLALNWPMDIVSYSGGHGLAPYGPN